MGAKAGTAAVMALASIHILAGSLLAKPTRMLPRPAAHRVLNAQPTTHAIRRAKRQTAGARPETAERTEPSPRTARSKRSTGALVRNAAEQRSPEFERGARSHSRVRNAAEEREQAARRAIDAADRHGRQRGRISNRDSAREAEVRQDQGTVARMRDTPERPATSRENSEAPALINVDGVLRPAPAAAPLKSIEEEAATPVVLPSLRVSSLYDSRGRLIVPPPLYGSHEILLHQNEMADRDGIDRVRDDEDLLELRRERKLVPLPESEALRVDYRLPENRRFSRPWTAAFLTVLAADYYASFHTPLQVDSAVRTIEVQEHLMRINGNAAPPTGDTASPHLTGEAVDIAKAGLTRTQIAWMRTYLQPLIEMGKIDVEEEFQQACFHISVYKSFLPITATHLSVATAAQPQEDSREKPTE